MTSEQRNAIFEMRRISEGLITGKVDFATFYETVASNLGNHFDPLDESLSSVDLHVQKELELYSRFTGGEFGEHKSMLPKNESWRYGENEPFGWIDKEKYVDLFRREFIAIMKTLR